MTISERLQGLYKPGAFNAGETKIQRTSQSGGLPQLVNKVMGKKIVQTENLSLAGVLSGKEKNSLQVLFGAGENPSSVIYGVNKLSNVHAGILLDVKG